MSARRNKAAQICLDPLGRRAAAWGNNGRPKLKATQGGGKQRSAERLETMQFDMIWRRNYALRRAHGHRDAKQGVAGGG